MIYLKMKQNFILKKSERLIISVLETAKMQLKIQNLSYRVS
jgi:hypothetical protein